MFHSMPISVQLCPCKCTMNITNTGLKLNLKFNRKESSVHQAHPSQKLLQHLSHNKLEAHASRERTITWSIKKICETSYIH